MKSAAAKYRRAARRSLRRRAHRVGPQGIAPAFRDESRRAGPISRSGLADALREFDEATAEGVVLIDVGCMQINHHFHGDRFASVAAMFEPHANVEYAARFLKTLRRKEGSWTLAVARYHAGPNNNPGPEALCLRRHHQHGGDRLRRVDRRGPRLLQIDAARLVNQSFPRSMKFAASGWRVSSDRSSMLARIEGRKTAAGGA